MSLVFFDTHSVGHHFLSPWIPTWCPITVSFVSKGLNLSPGSESDLVPCVLSVPSCSAIAIWFSSQTFWWRCVSQVSFFYLEFQHLFLLGSLLAALPCTLINGFYKYRPWSIPSNLSTSMDGCKYLSKTTTWFRAILFQLVLVFFNTPLNVSLMYGN